MFVLGRVLMVLGLLVGLYATLKGMFGSQIGMGEVGPAYKALVVALGLFVSGYLFSSGSEQDQGQNGQDDP